MPIKVTFGKDITVDIPRISDPTQEEQTKNQLINNPDKPVNNPTYKGITGKMTGWGPSDIATDISNSDWTPSNNFISVCVSMEKDPKFESGSEGVWHSEFPENGAAPYIIATDQDAPIQEEGVSITSDWWTKNAHNAGNSSELY